MKNVYFLFMVFVFLNLSGNLFAQFEEHPPKEKAKISLSENLQKGSHQIGIQGLNFDWGYGRIIGSFGVRYGYFIADKNLLFVDADFETYGSSSYLSYKLGLNYRRYFTDFRVKPFAQIGVNYGREKFYEDYSNFWGISTAAGAAIQVGRFSFEIGLQMDVRDKVSVSPLVGVSFKF
jgi:hypothetical protein